MKEYRLDLFLSEPDWSAIKRDTLTQCVWSPNKSPNIEIMGANISGERIVFRMENGSLPTRSEHLVNEAMVCEDDCLECFICMLDGRYFNIEVNSNGATRMRVGYSRVDRKPLADIIPNMLPKTSVFRTENTWGVEFVFAYEFLKEFCGIRPEKDAEFKANFYSCADKSLCPYYSAWNPVNTPNPDFHRPEFFGRIVFA